MSYIIKTKKVIELERNDICIINDEIYNIKDIWLNSIIKYNQLQHTMRFILHNENRDINIEKIYPFDYDLKIDENGFTIMD